jgi:pimeloyl-ACP methyl ester carboxylesterase
VLEVTLNDGRTLAVHDSGDDGFPLLWHHGSPQTGALLAPVLEAARARDLRLIGYARPSYGGSSPQPGRKVSNAAGDVAQLLDALGIDRFATMGASGGGPHALACAAHLGDRVTGAVGIATPAPFTTGFDWFAGMTDPRALRAATQGRDVRAAHAGEFDPDSFVTADWAALEREWKPLGEDAVRAQGDGADGHVDDDVAFVSPWGFAVDNVDAPVLLIQGGKDRVIPPAHAFALNEQLAHGELWLRRRDGHVSVLDAVPVAMDWLKAR